MTTAPYVPDREDLRAFSSFHPDAQAALKAGKTITGGDGRKFVLIDGHATAVGSDSYKRGMAAREEGHESSSVEQAEPSTPSDPRPPAPTGSGTGGQSPPNPFGNAAGSQSGDSALAAEQKAEAAALDARNKQNAAATLQGIFDGYGLGSLAPQILALVQQGYDPTSIGYLLQQTPEYKARFAANDSRVKNGLAPLTPAEYLATERAYRQALSSAGLPQSFYDNHADFTDYIAKDLSPAEIKTRADDAMQFVNQSDPQYINAFQQYYGAGKGEIAAYMLDGQRNTALLSKQITASQIGAAATNQGLQNPGRLQAEKYADLGVTQSQAQQGFQNVAAVLPTDSQIGDRFHNSYNQQDAQDEFLGGLASAQRKRQQLNKDEEGLFSGSSGVSPAALGIPTAGSY